MDLIAGLKLSSVAVLISMLILAIKRPDLLFNKFPSMDPPEAPIMVATGINMEELVRWCTEQHAARDRDRTVQIELYYRKQLNGRLIALETKNESMTKYMAEQVDAIRRDIAEVRSFVMSLRK